MDSIEGVRARINSKLFLRAKYGDNEELVGFRLTFRRLRAALLSGKGMEWVLMEDTLRLLDRRLTMGVIRLEMAKFRRQVLLLRVLGSLDSRYWG